MAAMPHALTTLAGLIVFLGILLWWIKAPPLIIICAVVIGLLIWDFVQSVRQPNGNG